MLTIRLPSWPEAWWLIRWRTTCLRNLAKDLVSTWFPSISKEEENTVKTLVDHDHDHVKVVISKFIQTLKFFNLSWQWIKTFEMIGIPSYTKYRDWCGLSRVHTWQDLQGIMPNKVRIMAEMTITGMNERMAKLCRYHHFSHFCGNSMLSTNPPMHIADKVFANVTNAFRQLLLTVVCMNLPKIW